MRNCISLAISLIALSGCLFVGFVESKAANLSNDASPHAELSQLEDRFFEHRYESESDDDRIDRLEEFVFGTHQKGSTTDRVKRLLATIPEDEAPQAESQPTAKSTAPPSHNNVASAVSSSAQNQAFSYGSYPRVTSLEQELLGHTYPNDSLQDRIKRLEIKAYGAPSGSSTELADKVDLLDDYAQRHDIYGEHKSVVSPPADTMAFNPTTPISHNFDRQQHTATDNTPWGPGAQQTYSSKTGTFVGSAEERVSMMEAQIFHHTYPDKSLDQRLQKLEKKILPNENMAQLSETAQTVKLWDTLHPNEANQVAVLADNDTGQVSDTSSPTRSSKRGSWLHRLATAGGSVADTSMGPSSNAPAAYGTNAGYMPGMFPANSHFVGASVGPGAGPAGLPVGFW